MYQLYPFCDWLDLCVPYGVKPSIRLNRLMSKLKGW